MNLQDKLEEVKQLGNYQVMLWYGEGIGADDSEVIQEKRKIVLMASPVGFLGEIRTLFRGSLKDLLIFDFAANKPKKVGNPPEDDEVSGPGYYAWGTERMIDDFLGGE